MSTLALVHGAWHGAWCWEQLTPELEALGHRVIAMDLPCDDGAATFDDYADVVCDAVAGVPGKGLVLVAHSLGGQTVARVAARRLVRHVVYVCAVPPVAGRSLSQELTDDTGMLNPDYLNGLGDKDAEGRRWWVDREVATRVLFGDCDEATATSAFARLRPQGTRAYAIPYSLPALPTVKSTYIVCTEDRLVNPDWSRHLARERLGIDLIELPGSHSPFLSRPRDLAKVLNGLT